MSQLCDQFMEFQRNIFHDDPEQNFSQVIPPCQLRIQPYTAYYCQDLLVCDVLVEDGSITCGTNVSVRGVSLWDSFIPLNQNHCFCTEYSGPYYQYTIEQKTIEGC